MIDKPFSSYMSFGEISEKWEKDLRNAYSLTDDLMTKEQIAFMLVCKASQGDFEFLLPDEKERKYVPQLFKDMCAKTLYKTESIKEQMQNIVKLPSLLDSSCFSKYLGEDHKPLVSEVRKISENIYINQKYFLMWCRINLMDLLRVIEEEKQYLVKPKFWGNPWSKENLPYYFDIAKNPKYPLSEASKFLLDIEFWDDYVKWSTNENYRNSGCIDAEKYNMFVDAEDRLEEYLKVGKLLLEGYENTFSVSDNPKIIPSDVISKMRIDYRDSSAIFGENKIKYLSVVIKSDVKAKNAGAHQKNAEFLKIVVETFEKKREALLRRDVSCYSLAKELYISHKNSDKIYSEKTIRSKLYKLCKDNNIPTSNSRKPKIKA